MTSDRPSVEVRPIRADEYPAAVAVLARGFRDNPIPVALLGGDASRRLAGLEALFGAMFRVLRTQTPIIALDGPTIVGVAGIAPPGTCQATPAQMLSMLPALAARGVRPLLRVGTWMRAWGRLDPKEPHSHFGPFAVDAHLHGRGIGSQILEAYCLQLDQAKLAGYLETETEDNVRLYSRFGFTVTSQQRVLGVPNWFMIRAPRSG